MSRRVYIYCDEGCSADSVQGWVSVLTGRLGHPEEKVNLTNCEELRDDLTRQPSQETALIMPGGADLAYVRRLEGSIKTIQHVIKEGGSYIGTCAGAYFASSACIFERDDPNLRVVGERKLCLFPYPAIGAVRENFCYENEAGATIENVLCEWNGQKFCAQVYCNGGPGWDVCDDKNTRVIGRYSEAVLSRYGVMNGSPAAVVAHRNGRGHVVLSGVHPELDGGEGEGESKLLSALASAAFL